MISKPRITSWIVSDIKKSRTRASRGLNSEIAGFDYLGPLGSDQGELYHLNFYRELSILTGGVTMLAMKNQRRSVPIKVMFQQVRQWKNQEQKRQREWPKQMSAEEKSKLLAAVGVPAHGRTWTKERTR